VLNNPPPPARRSLGFLLRESSRLMRRRFIHHARRSGLPLNRSEASLLWQVMHEPGVSQAGIANVLDLETISVVRLVDSLEQTGLLERRPHPKDRRVWTLWLTAKGDAATAQIARVNEGVRQEALAGLSPEEHAQLLDTLLKLRANLLRAAATDETLVA
jgi:MarR family transcriptional regulator, transcriptional regulator for hemolysin